MNERSGVITMKGDPLTLLGDEIKTGQQAPDCELRANDLSVVKLSDYQGKVCVISAVPSLDTPVCDIQTRTFNEKAANMGNAVVLTVSMDLPFAQTRWCGASGVDNVVTLSDFDAASFGTSFGVLVKEIRLLARSIFVLDKDGVIRYVQIVPELTHEPDYDAAIKAAEELI